MRRILIVAPHLYGSMRLLADYTRYLDLERNHITLLVLEPVLTLKGEFPPEIEIITLGGRAESASAGYTMTRAKLRHWVRCFIEVFAQAKRHDLVISWSELTPTYVTVAAGLLARKRVIGWVHIHLSRIFALGIRPRWLHAPAIRMLYPSLFRVVGCSALVSDDLRSKFGLKNVRCISNTVDFNRIRSCARLDIDDDLKEIYSQSAPVLINVAALERQKGHEVLLRAHANVIARGLVHHLVLVGEGTLKEPLVAMAKELGISNTVHFAGYRKNPYTLIARSSAFVLSSHMEGLPLVLAEALALGVPVVSTDCESGPREVLQDGRFGLLVPVNDHLKFADAISRILTEVDLRDQFAGEVRRHGAHLDAPSTVPSLESLFEEAAVGNA
jgi:glycosyltransferase involved in cell wall biosynthesis